MNTNKLPAAFLAILALSVLQARPGFAEEASAPSAPADWQTNYRSAGNRPSTGSIGESMREGPSGGIWQRNQLLGDPFGIRAAMGRYGLSISVQETSEYLGNVSGGTQKGFVYDGLTTMDLQLDTQRAFGLRNGLFNASALDVHGRNLSPRNLSTQQTASGIEADDGFRLWELWYQQAFAYRQIDIKIGAQSLDQEFMASQNAGLFVNTMFGWPMLTSADLLSGGPAYPLASLGARLRFQPMGGAWTFLGGVYDDNPSGITPGATSDPQRLNQHGTNFRLKDKPLAVMEVQLSRPANGEMQEAGESAILPGTFKIGAWYDFGNFADLQYGTDALSLSDPNSNGIASLHKGNYSIYAVADQLIWRESDESPKGIAFFIRAMGAPNAQNTIAFSLNAGLTMRAPFYHREYDAMGIGMGKANFSSRVTALDQDTNSFNQSTLPIRTRETFLELTYQYQLVPWWQLQPDIQYVFNPGGGLQNPAAASGARIANELVMGLRTNIAF